jgi:hypothetical protein
MLISGPYFVCGVCFVDGSVKEGVASPKAKAQSQASKKKAKKKKGGKW